MPLETQNKADETFNNVAITNPDMTGNDQRHPMFANTQYPSKNPSSSTAKTPAPKTPNWFWTSP